MSEEQPDPQQQTELPPVAVKEAEASPPKPQQPQVPDPRRRLRELLAIPERDRTDAVWDELVELEIQTGPGNRASTPQQNVGQRQDQNRQPEQQARRQDPSSGKRPGNRFVQKRRRGPGKPA